MPYFYISPSLSIPFLNYCLPGSRNSINSPVGDGPPLTTVRDRKLLHLTICSTCLVASVLPCRIDFHSSRSLSLLPFSLNIMFNKMSLLENRRLADFFSLPGTKVFLNVHWRTWGGGWGALILCIGLLLGAWSSPATESNSWAVC